ncbi:MAG: hypothetical protein F6J90_37470 [Moorea sp. SIOASIH]|uniref:hypothetical protein n=1 Tax=Moorena sp. SIOASIH TaxID=2607817 RepID=UPI0013BCFE86|nr:hypothetical protein [Moorena sp. SIOASIH]NEO41710.1 hypothetical protein [Moorena sp. SIOASIH]
MGETTAVAHGGDPQDRAASPRPRCLPKTALHRFYCPHTPHPVNPHPFSFNALFSPHQLPALSPYSLTFPLKTNLSINLFH